MFVALLLLTHLVVLLLTAWLSPTGATPAPWWLSSMDASSKASASVVKKKKKWLSVIVLIVFLNGFVQDWSQ